MFLKKLQSYFESIEFRPVSWLLGVSAVIFCRLFLEALSSPTNSPFFIADFSTIIHYYLFFISIFLLFVVFIQYFFKNLAKIAFQITALFSVVILVAPIVDFILSGGRGFKLAYIFEKPVNLIHSFFTFFGPNFKQGVTVGIRVEVLMIFLTVFVLSYLQNKKILVSIFKSLFAYLIIFLMLSLPSLVGLIGQFSFPNIEPLVYFQKIITTSQTTSGYLPSYLKYSSITVFMETAFNFFMAKIFFIISLVLTIFIFYKNNQSKFKTILENSRWERVIYYIFLILFGAWLAKILNPKMFLVWSDYLSIIILVISFYFAWLFAVFVNDREDISIDEISNKNRPLVQKKLDYQDLNQLLIILPVLFFISGYLAGFAPLFFVLCFSGLYYAYSARPTRFKIIPIFSSFIISLCALSMVLAGFFIIYPYKDLSLFPTKILVGIVVIYFLSSHIKDLKDLEGDAKSGIKTLPVMLGSLWAPKVVGVLSSLAYLLVPIFLSKIFLVTAIPFAITNYLLINRKPYQEKIVFFNYFIFIIFSFVLIHF